jgi:IgA Peptidase M64
MSAVFKLKIFQLFVCILLMATLSLKAQIFVTDTIVYQGNSSKFINVVFMGDGFQAAESAAYITNVRNVSNYLLSTSPFSEYKNYFNIFAITTPSAQSGALHPGTASDEGSSGGQPALSVTTYFNSTFDYFSIHRLLVPQNQTAINSVLVNNFPLYDQPLVIVNTTYYGGSGGFLATSSLNSSAFEIMVHEIGHSFAALADEYYAGDAYFAEKYNMTQQTNPALVKWKNWIGTNDIGIYPYCCGGNSALWYKPHQNCKMQYLGSPFCAVCKEAIIEKIHSLIGTPIINVQPSNLVPISFCVAPISPLKFSLSLVKPIPNTLKTTWTLNGTVVGRNIDSILINTAQLTTGSNVLAAQVVDTTLLTRSDTHPGQHTFTTNWAINIGPSANLLGADTSVLVVCANEKANISNLYNTTGLAASWDIANPALADTGTHFLVVTNTQGCRDTAFITVKQQVAHWIGNISSDWNNRLNWLPALVPGEKTHVIINSNTTFPCIISTQNAVAASIQVKPGGNYSVTNNRGINILYNCSSLPVQ